MDASSAILNRDPVFYRDVVHGLSASPKRLPCKYFYNKRGSELFDRICGLDEYYLTRTETAILEDNVWDIADRLCERPALFELGSGSSTKTRILLDHLRNVRAYVPMDISGAHLEQTAALLRKDYPELPVYPLVADYTRPYRLPEQVLNDDCVVAFFPGSTIGNFAPEVAANFLRRIHAALPSKGQLLIGVDLRKDRKILERAYDDSEGVTAEFNLNLLHRINDELSADFPVESFEHRVEFNSDESRVEMYLVATRACAIQLGDNTFSFEPEERIHTENSYKYSLETFARLAASAGFEVEAVWTDPAEWFSVQLLTKC